MSLKTLLLGPPLANREERGERIGAIRGISLLGLDALASAAYGPEALLTVLLGLGAAATGPLVPLTAAIVGLLVVVSISYRQTIAAYPDGGGSFTVAKENLGERAGILAASALALDYVLNVAVAISAGVGALVSAVPVLLPHTLLLCLCVLVVLTVVNLRGVRESSGVLAVPTYVFVLVLFATIALGVVRGIVAGGHPRAVAPPHGTHVAATEALGLWLVLRAFASGCTAMTGIEAVSNAVPVFRKPSTRGAQRTLGGITAILVVLLAGVAALARLYGVTATPPGVHGYESVLSQLLAAVFGRGVAYYVGIASIVTVLALSANTSFAGFPRLCRLLANDRLLPEPFAHRGRRLVYSEGILVLAGLATILLVVFAGVTDRLIPLFAVGALLAFWLSQFGMVVHGKRHGGSKRAIVLNAIGAVSTGSTLLVVLASKLVEGAWISVVVVAGTCALLAAFRRHFARLERVTALDGPLDLHPPPAPRVVVPIRRWDRAAQKALKFAALLSTDVTVVQVLTHDRKEDELTKRWGEIVEKPAAEAGVVAPKLLVVSSEYRELFAPLVAVIRRIGGEDTTRPIAVVVPEIVKPRWWHALLHNNTASLLKAILLMKGGPRVVVVNAPYYVSEEALERAKTAEGPAKASLVERARARLRPRVTAGT